MMMMMRRHSIFAVFQIAPFAIVSTPPTPRPIECGASHSVCRWFAQWYTFAWLAGCELFYIYAYRMHIYLGTLNTPIIPLSFARHRIPIDWLVFRGWGLNTRKSGMMQIECDSKLHQIGIRVEFIYEYRYMEIVQKWWRLDDCLVCPSICI